MSEHSCPKVASGVMHNTNWFGAFAVAILYAPPSLGLAATRVSVWEGLS
jgi:hypothetical protein